MRSPAARRLFVLRLVMMAWTVLSPAAILLLSRGASIGTLQRLPQIGWGVWTLFTVIELSLLTALVLENRGSSRTRLLKMAVAFGAASLLVGLARVASLMGSPLFASNDGMVVAGIALGVVLSVGLGFGLSLAFDVTLWLGLEALLPRRLERGVRGSYFALRFLSLAMQIWSIRWLIVPDAPRTGSNDFLYEIASIAESLACSGLVAYLVLKLARSGDAASVPAPLPIGQPTAGTDIVVGVSSLLAGIAITAVSYSSASGGGRYVVTTGLIAFGLVRVGRGIKNAR